MAKPAWFSHTWNSGVGGRALIIGLGIVGLGVLNGLMGNPAPVADEPPVPNAAQPPVAVRPPSPAKPSPPPKQPYGFISKATFKGEWPLKVDNAIMGCDYRVNKRGSTMKAVIVTIGDDWYTVNGAARTLYPSAMTVNSQQLPGTSVGDIVAYGLTLC